MSVIENFAVLSEQEQHEFAAKLLEKINSEKIFSDTVSFQLNGVEADDFTGDLWILLSDINSLKVARAATWNTYDDTDKPEDEDTIEYENTSEVDIIKTFKTSAATVDDYTISIAVDDYNENEIVDVEVTGSKEADDGIGDYEYFGFRGYDSHPYYEMEGILVRDYDCYLSLRVEPN